MTDIIQIPGCNATGQYQEGTLLVLQGTYTTQDEACHKCGSIGNLYKHGTKVLRYRDEALGSICTSCGGKFADLHTHTIPAILPGQKPKRDYICATCYARFHTKEVGHGNQDSTPKCG